MHISTEIGRRFRFLALAPVALLAACGSNDPCDEFLGKWGVPGDFIEITRNQDIFTLAGTEGMVKDLKVTGTCNETGLLTMDVLGAMSVDRKYDVLLTGGRKIPRLK